MDNKLPNLIDKHVGQRMRSRRKELKLSQEALAERLGVTFQQVQKYERGANRVSAGRLYELARALDTTIVYFFQGVDAVGQALTRHGLSEGGDIAGLIDADALDLMFAFQSISDPTVRRNIVALVKSQAAALVDGQTENQSENQAESRGAGGEDAEG